MDTTRFWEIYIPQLRRYEMAELDFLKAIESAAYAFRTIRKEEG